MLKRCNSRRKRRATGLHYPSLRHNPLTLPLDRLIEHFIAARLVCVSFLWLLGTSFHPAAGELLSVGLLQRVIKLIGAYNNPDFTDQTSTSSQEELLANEQICH